MLTAHDQGNRVLTYQGAIEDRIINFAFHRPQLGRVLDNRLGDLRCIANVDIEADHRMSSVELGEARWQPVTGNGLARMNRQPPAREPAEIIQGRFGGCDLRQNAPCFNQEGLAGLVEENVSANASNSDTPWRPSSDATALLTAD